MTYTKKDYVLYGIIGLIVAMFFNSDHSLFGYALNISLWPVVLAWKIFAAVFIHTGLLPVILILGFVFILLRSGFILFF